MSELEVLIPTYRRQTALATTLATLVSQTYLDFSIVISEQNSPSLLLDASIQTILRLLSHQGHRVLILSNPQAHGIAHQRQLLLEATYAPYCVFLDDDLVLEAFVFDHLVTTINYEQCGFVGAAPIGLSFREDVRPEEQSIEFWNGRVQPERVVVEGPQWERYKLHNAANLLHVAQRYNLSERDYRTYKVAWVGGCVLFDREKLIQCGGFSFWDKLPRNHAGEDAWVQLKVMSRFGGCALIPSGVYHQEQPTTLPKLMVDAPKFFGRPFDYAQGKRGDEHKE